MIFRVTVKGWGLDFRRRAGWLHAALDILGTGSRGAGRVGRAGIAGRQDGKVVPCRHVGKVGRVKVKQGRGGRGTGRARRVGWLHVGIRHRRTARERGLFLLKRFKSRAGEGGNGGKTERTGKARRAGWLHAALGILGTGSRRAE